jgi:DNA polymerase-3 subunit alpha
MNKEKIVFHLHDDTSNCNGYADSCTNFKDYIKLAKRDGDKAIAFSNHGGIYDWVKKKQECDKAGIKYIHGIEAYMCDRLEDNDRGYHIGMYARNWDGVLELNTLISKSFSKGVKEDNSDRHVYYNPRLSMEEIMGTSDNIVITTACVQSILWRFTEMSKSLDGIKEEEIIKTNIKDRLNQFKIESMDEETLEKYGKQKGKKRLEFLSQINGDIEQLKNHYMDRRNVFLKWIIENKHRVFIEAQAHLFEDQMEYNKLLMKWHDAYGLKIIAGTYTHSSTDYKAECREILQVSKDSFYGDEDKADLTWKNYDGIVNMFKKQGVLSDEKIHEAIENTVVFGDMFEDYELDTSFKYPDFYKDAKQELRDMVELEYQKKKDSGEIDKSRDSEYRVRIEEELNTYDIQGMNGFILFVAEMLNWCHENDIPTGDRGSFTGSLIGFVTNMTDVDSIVCNTIFSRFCNIYRISLGD